MTEQWKKALLIQKQLEELDNNGQNIEKSRDLINKIVEDKYGWCHGCLLLAVYGFYKNGMIASTSRVKAVNPKIDFNGFNGHYSKDIKHAFDALELLKRNPNLTANQIKTELGGEASIYSFVIHYFKNGLLRLD